MASHAHPQYRTFAKVVWSISRLQKRLVLRYRRRCLKSGMWSKADINQALLLEFDFMRARPSAALHRPWSRARSPFSAMRAERFFAAGGRGSATMSAWNPGARCVHRRMAPAVRSGSAACARGHWNGSSSNSRCAGAPSCDVAVMPATAASISSDTTAMMSSISRRLSGANSAEKLRPFKSQPSKAQTRVPATRNG